MRIFELTASSAVTAHRTAASRATHRTAHRTSSAVRTVHHTAVRRHRRTAPAMKETREERYTRNRSCGSGNRLCRVRGARLLCGSISIRSAVRVVASAALRRGVIFVRGICQGRTAIGAELCRIIGVRTAICTISHFFIFPFLFISCNEMGARLNSAKSFVAASALRAFYILTFNTLTKSPCNRAFLLVLYNFGKEKSSGKCKVFVTI